MILEPSTVLYIMVDAQRIHDNGFEYTPVGDWLSNREVLLLTSVLHRYNRILVWVII